MAPTSPMSSRSSSPVSSSDEEERQEAKRRKAQFQAAAAQTAQNGAEASSSVFVPPKGMKKASGDETLTEFSLEAIKDKLSKGCELWAVRLPSNLNKLRYMNDIKITVPDHADASTSAASEKIAEFQHKKSDYEIYSLTDNTQDVSDIGAGEMRNMTALLANKRKKYSAVPIQRHIVVKQTISFPPEDRPNGASETGYVKHQQPEGLDGFFAPYGFETDLNKARRKRARLDGGAEDDTSLPPPLASVTQQAVSAPSQAVEDSNIDITMSEDATLSKEERKRLKKEKRERKEEKRRRRSEAAAAAAASTQSQEA